MAKRRKAATKAAAKKSARKSTKTRAKKSAARHKRKAKPMTLLEHFLSMFDDSSARKKKKT